MAETDSETYAIVLHVAAKLLSYDAAKRRRRNDRDHEAVLLSAAWCLTLAEEYEKGKRA